MGNGNSCQSNSTVPEKRSNSTPSPTSYVAKPTASPSRENNDATSGEHNCSLVSDHTVNNKKCDVTSSILEAGSVVTVADGQSKLGGTEAGFQSGRDIQGQSVTEDLFSEVSDDDHYQNEATEGVDEELDILTDQLSELELDLLRQEGLSESDDDDATQDFQESLTIATNGMADHVKSFCNNVGREYHIIKHYSPLDVCCSQSIGEGGFGRVLKGNLWSGTQVAIKLFHTAPNLTKEVYQLFTLKHKNLVKVLGIVPQVEDTDSVRLILQFFPEGNVLQWLGRHQVPEDFVQGTLGKIAVDVVEGCKYLHQKNIVHGNLAARNIILGKMEVGNRTYYNAKICDVGVIRFAVEASGGNFMRSPGNNKMVPVRWVPKEMVEENGSPDFTFSSDVWSFGVLLWEMWTRGAVPYGVEYSNMRVVKFLMEGFSPLKIHRPAKCPGEVVAIMNSIFQVDPTKRPTFKEIQTQLKKYRGHGQNHVKYGKGKSSSGITATDWLVDENSNEPCRVLKGSEKLALKKKKKNWNVKNPQVAGYKSKTPKPAPHSGASGFTSGMSEEAGTSASNQAKNLPKSTSESTTDAVVAALLERVSQLEKARRDGPRRGSRGVTARGGRGTRRGANWHQPRNRRQSAQPRLNEAGDGRPSTSELHSLVRGETSAAQSSPPPLQAPPPYTEDPLPHHSLSAREYEHTPGVLVRGYSILCELRGSPRVVLERAPATQVDLLERSFIKMKRLAEELELLRTAQMTQQLLNKSFELAEQIRLVSREIERYQNGIYAADRRGIQAGAMSADDDEYNAGVFEDYEYANQRNGGGRWNWQNSRSVHSTPPYFQTSADDGAPYRGNRRSVNHTQRGRPYFRGRDN